MTATEMTPEFKAHFSDNYFRHYTHVPPNYNQCCTRVRDGDWSHKQCARKNGFGPDGAYCKQHDPAAVNARSLAATAKWRAEADIARRREQFTNEAKAYVRSIAAGMTDPDGVEAKTIVARSEVTK